MDTIISVDPFRCRMWSLHDRLEEHITEHSCREMIESVSDRGQLVAVLGRPVQGDPDFDYELIYGARRLFVARHLNLPLRLKIECLSDQDAIVAMDIENRQRKDISPYERGLSYASWLRGGYFSSQDEVAKALKVSASQVSRLLKLARLPNAVVNAFGTALEIREGWGVSLSEMLDDPLKRQAILQAARTVSAASPRPLAREVYRKLVTCASRGRKLAEMAHDKVVKADDGTTLFRVRYQQNAVALVLPLQRASASCLDTIEVAVSEILRKSGSQCLVDVSQTKQLQHANR